MSTTYEKDIDGARTDRYHERVRNDMNVRSTKYGFYTVVKETTPKVLCECGLDVTHRDGVIVNGKSLCVDCYRKYARS